MNKKTITFLTVLIVLFAITMFNSCEEPPTDAPIIITQITGKVFDKESNTALNGVQITTLPVTSSVITGSDGSYTLAEIDPGIYKVTAQKDGYNTNSTDVTVTEGKSVSADILLSTQTPELGVNPETLDFEIQQTSLTFNITNLTNIGEVSWSIGVNQPWLTVSPSIGSTTRETDFITVTVDRDSLNYGNYSALIAISSDYGTKHVNVVMIKSNPNAPQLSVAPNELDFGNENITKTLLIKNTGSGTLTWTATANDSWIIYSPNSGSAKSGEASSVLVSLYKNGLTANNYNGLILINSNGGSEEVNVTMTVQEGTLDSPELQVLGTPTTNSISLAWNIIDDSHFDNYKIYRSIISNVDENNGTLIKTITNKYEHNYTDEGLNSGTTYFYKVYAYSSNGIGSASNEVIATTKREFGSWVSTETIQNLNASYIEPVSEDDVWLTSGNSIWHYNGSDWSKYFTCEYNIEAISFESSNNGWVLSADNDTSAYIYKYDGISWNKGERQGFSHAEDMLKFSDNNIWVLGKNRVYHYNGSQWKETTLDINYGIDIDAISENDIWALGTGGKVFHYNGVGWMMVERLPFDFYYNYTYHTMEILSANDIWIAEHDTYGYNSGLHHYNGNEFNDKYKASEAYENRYALEMISTNEGWSSKGNKLSYFDGHSWEDVEYPVDSRVVCINFLTRDKGWAVTSDGTILRYVE